MSHRSRAKSQDGEEESEIDVIQNLMISEVLTFMMYDIEIRGKMIMK